MHDRADELIAAAGATSDGSVRAALANPMVGIKKRYYGRGPEGARAYVEDDYIFVVLEGGLTRNEETLLEAGKEQLVREYRLPLHAAGAAAAAGAVREYRLAFQAVVTEMAVGAVEELVGRRVIGYHSQIVFNPTKAFEIFAL